MHEVGVGAPSRRVGIRSRRRVFNCFVQRPCLIDGMETDICAYSPTVVIDSDVALNPLLIYGVCRFNFCMIDRDLWALLLRPKTTIGNSFVVITVQRWSEAPRE